MEVNRFINVFGILPTILICLAYISLASGQLRLEYSGSTEILSDKCIISPMRMDVNLIRKQVCFCVIIQEKIPTYNCIRGGAKVTTEDLDNLVGTIRNLTRGQFPSPFLGSGTALGGASDLLG